MSKIIRFKMWYWPFIEAHKLEHCPIIIDHMNLQVQVHTFFSKAFFTSGLKHLDFYHQLFDCVSVFDKLQQWHS